MHKLKILLRELGLLGFADLCRYNFTYLKNYFKIRNTMKKYPDFVFPPPYYIYETYHLNYENYYADGAQTAKEIGELINKFTPPRNNSIRLLDWGCGPARVVRHFKKIYPNWIAYGSDYNFDYIAWNKENIEQVTFQKNEVNPPLNYENNFFDVVYSLSIITHLSEEMHYAWIKELYRILKPNGILLITTQGEIFKHKLSALELEKYNQNELVIREDKIEGHRNYSAFQPKVFMEKLLQDFEILEFIPGNSKESIHGEQDTWLVRKNNKIT
jgi:SAM-dependent methyltransferase